VNPFRFGVQLASAYDGQSWRDKARLAEELGYSTLFLPDHLDTQWGPLVAMTVAAEATSTLKVGSLVLANDYRHPVVLAKEIATLDLVSAGRVEVGIGAGWRKKDYQVTGLPFDSPGERIDRLADSVLIMKDLWADAASSRQGRHYTVDAPQGMPLPHSRPHPPILMGGGGRKMLSLAAREADIVGFNPSMAGGRVGNQTVDTSGPDAFSRRVDWVKAAAGPRWDSLEFQCLTVVCRVTKDRDASLLAYARASGMTPEALAAAPLALVGSVEEICETLAARRDTWGFSYWVVHEQEMRDFAPVIARMAGN
jgi:probable F420-dependent oxidoreductase